MNAEPARRASSMHLSPLTVRVSEACRLTGIGRSKLYELIKAREIETIKVGAMTLIPFASLQAFVGVGGAHPTDS
jgi:excisionase family DNA binding protein